jgi:hypothetical protein
MLLNVIIFEQDIFDGIYQMPSVFSHLYSLILSQQSGPMKSDKSKHLKTLTEIKLSCFHLNANYFESFVF